MFSSPHFKTQATSQKLPSTLPRLVEPNMRGIKCLRPWHIKAALPIWHKPWAFRALGTAHHLPTNMTRTPDELSLTDRHILNPERAETCQFGTDDEVARHKSPYDPSTTTVENEVLALREEYKREGNTHDPLLVSPANLDVSRPLELEITLPLCDLHLLGSVKGWSNKNKKVLLRTEPYVARPYENVFYYYIMNHKNFAAHSRQM